MIISYMISCMMLHMMRHNTECQGTNRGCIEMTFQQSITRISLGGSHGMDLCLASEALAESPRRYLVFTVLVTSDLIETTPELKSEPFFLRSTPGIHFNRTRTEPGTKAASRQSSRPGDPWRPSSPVRRSQRRFNTSGMKFKTLCFWRLDVFCPETAVDLGAVERLHRPISESFFLRCIYSERTKHQPMSKRNAKSIDEVLASLRRGDGQGEGATYRPYFHVRDVPSQGRSAIDLGIKTGRLHHFLSDIEYAYFLLAEFSIFVRAIREQYALLPWNETLQIALLYDIAHPLYLRSRVPRVLTSDLVLTMTPPISPPYLVISCKCRSDLDPANPESSRTLEKLLLEKVYWSRRPARWILGTDDALPINKVHNLDFFRPTVQSRERDGLNPLLPGFISFFNDIWSNDRSLNVILRRTARHFRIEMIEAFTLLGRAVWQHKIPVDLDAARLSHEEPIPLALNETEYCAVNPLCST